MVEDFLKFLNVFKIFWGDNGRVGCGGGGKGRLLFLLLLSWLVLSVGRPPSRPM